MAAMASLTSLVITVPLSNLNHNLRSLSCLHNHRSKFLNEIKLQTAAAVHGKGEEVVCGGNRLAILLLR
nr:hypothetical protein Iba_chr06aCG2650 [Ipomoea batatas]